MSRSPARRRPNWSTVLLASVALFSVVTTLSSTLTASADTSTNLVVTRATTPTQTDVAPNGPLTGLKNLDMVTLNLTADGLGATPNIVFSVDVRMCRPGINITLAGQFNASAGNCIANPLSVGSSAFVQKSFAAPNTSGSASYIIGTGAETVATHVGPGTPIVCGPGNPCSLWLREAVPTGIVASGSAFVHFNLDFLSTTSPPGAPTAATATAGNGQANVAWTAPADPGSAAVTSYTVTSSPGGLTCTTATTACAVTGLDNFTAYTFSVIATNGDSLAGPASSPSSAVTPLPSLPVVSSVTAGNASATINWTASSPAPTNYTVTSTPGSLTCATSALTCTVAGLTNGTGYTFTVRANYPSAHSVVSAASATVTPAPPAPGQPGAPTSASATAGNGQANVSWTAPVDTGNSSITSYSVTSSPAGGTCTTNATSCTVTGLNNFTAYTFAVTATNAASFTSAASSPSNAVTPLPAAAGTPSAVAADVSAVVTWTAANPAPTSYTITSTPGNLTCTTAALTCTVNGLTNGTAYTFVAKAIYGANSIASGSSTPVTPLGAPGVPTAVTATAGNGQAGVTFTAPITTGGAAITSYKVTSSPAGGTCTTAVTSCTVTSLSNFTSYTFTVTATNAASKTGPASSASNAVTPLPSSPGTPAVVAGNASAVVTWTAANPTPINYTVTSTPGGLFCSTSALTCTVNGLTNGTGYTFTVVANYSGPHTASSGPSTSVTPTAPAAPGAPTGVNATPGNGQALVSWTAPTDDGGSSISSYTVTASSVVSLQQQRHLLVASGPTCSTSATSCTVTGLDNFSHYLFTVTATNGFPLTSSPSAESATITPLPVAPIVTTVTPGDRTVTIVWSAADPTPTGYSVTGIPGGSCPATTATMCTITGLTNGTSYTFVITATYSGGEVASAASAAVVPAIAATTTTTSTAVTSATAPGTSIAPRTAGSSSTAAGTLPKTGSDSGFLVQIGGLSLVLGMGLVLIARRRRDAGPFDA